MNFVVHLVLHGFSYFSWKRWINDLDLTSDKMQCECVIIGIIPNGDRSMVKGRENSTRGPGASTVCLTFLQNEIKIGLWLMAM